MTRLAAYLREDRARAAILVAFAVAQLALVGWDLPSSFSWENDGVAPHDIPVGVAQNLIPGSSFRYPLFHLALLAALCLPVLAPAALRARSFALDDLRAAVLTPATMTACSIVAKLVAVAMGVMAVAALGRIAERLFSRRAALWAMFFAATNVSVAYYGRTSNLDGPALFWTVLAIERLLDDRDGRGGPRDLAWAAAFAAAAVATKDQAYASFLLVVPAALLVRRRRGVAAAIGVGALVYAVLGGAALNPTGFAARVATLIGPASEDYRAYAPSLAGRLANLGDLAAAQGAMFWSWPVVALAAAGIARSARSLRACLPLLAGLGSVVGFALVVGRCEHRFVLPFGFFLSIHAGRGAEALLRPRVLAAAAGALAAAGPLALALTQLGDARRAVEAWLDRLPRGAAVETYGSLVFLPRFPTDVLAVRRVGPDPPGERDPLPGMAEIVGSPADAPARAPDAIVLTEGFVEPYLRRSDGAGRILARTAAAAQADVRTRDFVTRAIVGRVPGYRLALVAGPSLPAWAAALGLRPAAIHQSTGQMVWVLARAR